MRGLTQKQCPVCGKTTFVNPGKTKGFCSDECKIAGNVEVTASGCWEWTGYRDPQGYGRMSKMLAHRLSYQTVYGVKPGELAVRHKCDNPPCVNPDHLELGTHQDNMNDSVARGRRPNGERCPNAKLTDSDVLAIRASTARTGELAKRYGVSTWTITSVRNGSNWKHLLP